MTIEEADKRVREAKEKFWITDPLLPGCYIGPAENGEPAIHLPRTRTFLDKFMLTDPVAFRDAVDRAFEAAGYPMPPRPDLRNLIEGK